MPHRSALNRTIVAIPTAFLLSKPCTQFHTQGFVLCGLPRTSNDSNPRPAPATPITLTTYSPGSAASASLSGAFAKRVLGTYAISVHYAPNTELAQ